MSTALNRIQGSLTSSQRSWLAVTAFATLMLGAIIPAVVYAGLIAFGYRIATPSGFSRVTLSFLVLLVAALIQALLAGRGSPWPKALNWFIGLWLAYWLWGVALYTFGYETALTRVLFADNVHPATWGLPAVLLLVWWLRSSGLTVRRGLNIALFTLLIIVFSRIALDFVLSDSEDLFSWTTGFGWFELPFRSDVRPLAVDEFGPTWYARYHWETYGVTVRPSLIFVHANTLGLVSAIGFVYFLSQASFVTAAIAAAFGSLVVASTSNTAVVGATAGLLTIVLARLWSSGRTKTKVLLSALFGGACIVLVSRATFDSFSFMGRRSLWIGALESINTDVLIGLGGLSWETSVTQGSPVGVEFHNSFLSATAWGGLVGLVLLGALWVLGAVLALRAVKTGNLTSLALLTTCLVLSMTESTFAYRYWSMGNALLLAAVLLSQWRPGEVKDLPTELGAQTAVPRGGPLQTRQPK